MCLMYYVSTLNIYKKRKFSLSTVTKATKNVYKQPILALNFYHISMFLNRMLLFKLFHFVH